MYPLSVCVCVCVCVWTSPSLSIPHPLPLSGRFRPALWREHEEGVLRHPPFPAGTVHAEMVCLLQKNRHILLFISVLFDSIKFSFILVEWQSYYMKVILCHPRFQSLSPVTSSCGDVHGDDAVCVTSDPVVHAPQCRGYGGLPGTNRRGKLSYKMF